MSVFKRATRRGIKLRLALVGPSGSGKTYTSLLLAHQLLGLRPGDAAAAERIALLDTEQGSSFRYADRPFAFSAFELSKHDPRYYIRGIDEAREAGFEVLIIDSLSHAWSGKGGALDLVDKHKKGDSSWSGWAEVTPIHREMVEALLASQMHIIATMRAKTEWTLDGKRPVKVGIGPDQRAGIDYEFDVVLDLDQSHQITASKTRCAELDGKEFRPGDSEIAAILRRWAEDSDIEPEPPAAVQAPAPRAESNGKATPAATPEPATEPATEPERSDHHTVANLCGRYSHAASLDGIAVIDADRDAAVKAGKLRTTGESWPAIEAAREAAQADISVAGALCDGLAACADALAVDELWRGVGIAERLKADHPLLAIATRARITAYARVATDIETLTAARQLVDEAMEGGVIDPFDGTYEELLSLLADRETRIAELEEA